MTTRDEAIGTILNALDDRQIHNTRNAAVTHIVDKLIAYGIHPNAIKAAFFEEAKIDVDKANQAK